MSRISVLLAVTALSVSSFAHAADRDRSRDTDQECTRQEKALHERAQQQETQPAVAAAKTPTLEDSFVTVDAASIETADGVSAMVGPIEVVVARFGPDGKPVMACVDNPEAARRFFKAPAETLAPKQKKE